MATYIVKTDGHPETLEVLPCGAIQIQAVCHPGDFNCGPHVLLFALCEDASIWVKYDSSGSSNVPTDGLWHNVNMSAAATTESSGDE